MTIRLAEPNDLMAVISFDAYPGARVVEIVERRMLVADNNGQVEAYAAWQKNGCIGMDYVNKLVVREDCRRRGLASQLIAALNMVLVGRVFISAPGHNLAALALLAATGWTHAGEIVGLLPLGEPEIFFHKDLWPEPAP